MRIIIRLLVLLWLALTAGSDKASDIWTVISADPEGDVRDRSLPDVAQLSYRHDRERDTLWLRVTLYAVPTADAFDVDVAIDTGADAGLKTKWPGENREFTFDKMITARVTRRNRHYTGEIALDTAPAGSKTNSSSVRHDNGEIRVEGDSILIGVKRTDLTDRMQMNLVAAVGSSGVGTDEIPNARSAAIDLAAARPSRALREIDVTRNNLRFAEGYRTLSIGQHAQVTTAGSGREPLILVPGVYSGEHVFDGFIARNGSRYRFHVLTPPGLNGTPARALPPETASYGEYPWTRALESDVVDLIKREKLDKPIVIAHGFPGSLAAEEIGVKLPGLLAGIVETSSIAVQAFPSFRAPGRAATPDERIATVNAAWAQKWFKYVTPETWESNNYPADMLSNDPMRAERARVQLEAAPLPIKIRYLSEFMASDHTAALTNFAVPLLVLRPGFNETLLANPANGWFKAFFLDSWAPFSSNARIQLVTIPNARALVFDDQPDLADEAVAAFVGAHSPRRSTFR